MVWLWCVCVIVGVDSVWCVMCVHGDKSVHVLVCSTCMYMYTTASDFWNDNALLGILQDLCISSVIHIIHIILLINFSQITM